MPRTARSCTCSNKHHEPAKEPRLENTAQRSNSCATFTLFDLKRAGCLAQHVGVRIRKNARRLCRCLELEKKRPNSFAAQTDQIFQHMLYAPAREQLTLQHVLSLCIARCCIGSCMHTRHLSGHTLALQSSGLPLSVSNFLQREKCARVSKSHSNRKSRGDPVRIKEVEKLKRSRGQNPNPATTASSPSGGCNTPSKICSRSAKLSTSAADPPGDA